MLQIGKEFSRAGSFFSRAGSFASQAHKAELDGARQLSLLMQVTNVAEIAKFRRAAKTVTKVFRGRLVAEGL